ncbi:MAG: nucleoside hydrolase [Chthoniobacterales bacterium]
MRLATFLLCLLLADRLSATTVWIDTDCAIGAPWREVDDGFALILAFHSPQLQIAGISTTYGNAGLSRTDAVTRNIVRRFGAAAGVSEASVFSGARRAGDLRGAADATEALAHALQTQKLTYVALGPLTNLAAFLQLHPELAPRIERLIFVGGRTRGRALAFGKNGALQIHDANVVKDPTAARTVCASKIPITLVPPEAGARLSLTRDDARQLAAGGDAAQFLQRGSRVWLWFWTAVVGERGGPLFDALAVVAAVKPGSLPIEKRYASVRRSGELIVVPEAFRGAREVNFCTTVGSDTKGSLMRGLLRDAPRG